MVDDRMLTCSKNYVRMYTNQSYYEAIDYDMLAESSEERRDHKGIICDDLLP